MQEPLPEPTRPIEFEEGVFVGGDGRFEATLEIRGADALVCMSGGGDDDAVYASLDEGASWARLPIDRSLRGSSDCDPAIGGDGTWYVILMDVVTRPDGRLATNGQLVFGRSADQGQTWTWSNILLASLAGGIADRPWLEAIDSSTLYLTYKSSSTSPIQSWFQRSDDGGSTWSTPVSIATVSDFPAHRNAGMGKMAVTDAGRSIYVPIHTWDNDDLPTAGDEPRWLDLAISHDAGASWTIKPVMGPAQFQQGPHHNPSLALVGDRIYFGAPIHNPSGGVDQTVVLSTDDGDTWSDPILLASSQEYPAGAQAYMAMDAGPHEALDVAWYHWSDGWIISMARISGSELVWSTNVTEPSGQAETLEFLWLTHDERGRAWIAYPIPESPCPTGSDWDCLWVLREKP